jgi:hypothetical protein
MSCLLFCFCFSFFGVVVMYLNDAIAKVLLSLLIVV